jgi:hypothetical protein
MLRRDLHTTAFRWNDAKSLLVAVYQPSALTRQAPARYKSTHAVCEVYHTSIWLEPEQYGTLVQERRTLIQPRTQDGSHTAVQECLFLSIKITLRLVGRASGRALAGVFESVCDGVVIGDASPQMQHLHLPEGSSAWFRFPNNAGRGGAAPRWELLHCYLHSGDSRCVTSNHRGESTPCPLSNS